MRPHVFTDRLTGCLLGLGADTLRVEQVVAELGRRYSEGHRHYHALAHLAHVYGQLSPVLDRLQDENVVVFAIAYHDAVYDVKRSDNEERSADLARATLMPLGIARDLIDHCATMILATKGHTPSEDPDTNLFTDADLSILGSPPENYRPYAEQVRKEHGIYPDFLYKPGRRKVLAHFLDMDRIFKTDHFHGQLETQARSDLREELERLG